MAKLSISRLLEASKLLQTNAGKDLQELIEFVNDLANQIIGALRQGLTFQDNVKCLVSVVALKHDTEQRVNNPDDKQIFGIFPVRVNSTTTGVSGFLWYINSSNQLIVKAQFIGAPTDPVETTLIILFV